MFNDEAGFSHRLRSGLVKVKKTDTRSFEGVTATPTLDDFCATSTGARIPPSPNPRLDSPDPDPKSLNQWNSVCPRVSQNWGSQDPYTYHLRGTELSRMIQSEMETDIICSGSR